MTDIRKAAFDLYTPPFRHEHGYIFDANDQVVADDGAAGEMKGLIAARIRGWGRIQYMDNPEGRAAKLQDEVGAIVADALNAWWRVPSGMEIVAWYCKEHGDVNDIEWNRQKPRYEGEWKPLYAPRGAFPSPALVGAENPTTGD